MTDGDLASISKMGQEWQRYSHITLMGDIESVWTPV